jgi:hypothetical protein
MPFPCAVTPAGIGVVAADLEIITSVAVNLSSPLP